MQYRKFKGSLQSSVLYKYHSMLEQAGLVFVKHLPDGVSVFVAIWGKKFLKTPEGI